MFNAAEQLVQQVGHALVVQVHLYDLAEVGVHQLHDEVHVAKLLKGALRREGIE